MIGEFLNEKQIAVLQGVAGRAFGARFASVKGIKEEIDTGSFPAYRCFQDDEDIAMSELDAILNQLVEEGLVERRNIRGEDHAGLTDDGARCNHIEVF